MTVHFVYTIGEKKTTPEAITNNVAAALRAHYPVKVYDWLSRETIRPESGDVLLGHPAPPMGTIFRNSIGDSRWAKRIIMSPFAHAIPELISFIDPMMSLADRYLAITGEYWMKQMPNSICDHWFYKTTQLDLAVDEIDFPWIKQSFKPLGQRRFLFIGRNGPGKGTEYFAQLAEANPGMGFGAIGQKPLSRKITSHGRHYTAAKEIHPLVREYDFFLTCGSSDPNPTTILEATSWGLIPICTPQSGYLQTPWLINIPLHDVTAASLILAELQKTPDETLLQIQNAARQPLRTHFSWDRFNRQVLEAIAAPIPQPPMDAAWRERATRNSAALQRIESRRIRRDQFRHIVRLPDQTLRRSFRKFFPRKAAI